MDSDKRRGKTGTLAQIASLQVVLRDQNLEAREVLRDYMSARTTDGRVDSTPVSTFLDRYEETAHKLLSLLPDDPDARAALDSAVAFRSLLQLF